MKQYKGSTQNALIILGLYILITMTSFWVFYNWMFKV